MTLLACQEFVGLRLEKLDEVYRGATEFLKADQANPFMPRFIVNGIRDAGLMVPITHVDVIAVIRDLHERALRF